VPPRVGGGNPAATNGHVSHLQSPRTKLPAAVRRALTASEQSVAARYATKVGAESLLDDLRRLTESVGMLMADGNLPRATSERNSSHTSQRERRDG
jgi:hypothetical protein